MNTRAYIILIYTIRLCAYFIYRYCIYSTYTIYIMCSARQRPVSGWRRTIYYCIITITRTIPCSRLYRCVLNVRYTYFIIAVLRALSGPRDGHFCTKRLQAEYNNKKIKKSPVPELAY